jgi:hypothetical protein
MSKRAEISDEMARRARRQTFNEIPRLDLLNVWRGELALAEEDLRLVDRLAGRYVPSIELAQAFKVLRREITAVRDANAAYVTEAEPFVSDKGGAPQSYEAWTAAILFDEYGEGFLAAAVRASWPAESDDAGLVKNRHRVVKEAQQKRHEMLAAVGKRPGRSNAERLARTDPFRAQELELGIAVELPFVDELSQRRALRSGR